MRNTTRLPVWQRNYYEHVIRNEDELNQIREYTVNNPIKWALDEDNPINVGRVGGKNSNCRGTAHRAPTEGGKTCLTL